ncbi:hypothetical protein ONA91_24455 [Micromonospora sp. DR5-3]|uniref:hypothetical protein n=1 Tax=unclassified Micromonospora TaxID=2617518 RepID=UPI0011D9A0A8|nr:MULTISPECIES: hypothetical protein [unclassified Micromonospora]MCW3817611.1 hypothetical protein [Micromonospora sp. DR5-3]TYC22033.1 hypothetical protein FXF52_22625 [Micromonospora sp. MP36]
MPRTTGREVVGPFTALVRLASSDALPAPAGPQDPLGGYRPILRTLLRELARTHAVRYAALWLPAGTAPGTSTPPWTPAITWRSRRWAQGALPNPVADPDLLLDAAGVVATADVTDGGARYGVLVLAHPENPRYPLAVAAPLGETAVCVGLLLRQAHHHAACTTVRARVDRAVQRVSATQLELLTVQAVERDRLATAVTATPGRQLRAILDRAADLERALRTGSPQATAIAGGIRAGLGEMIEQFRSVVRGVYPQVLRSTGVRAALEEVTAALPVPVVFGGELGRRQGWEVESGLYQAGASAAAALGASGGEQPVHLELGRSAGVLTIRAQRAGAEPNRVAAALRDDSRRLAALGGRLRVERAGRGTATVVDILLPERLGGDWPEPARPAAPEPAGPQPRGANAAAPELPVGASARRLLTLLVTGREAPADSPPLRVAVDRQDAQARVVVVGASAPELLSVLYGPASTARWEPPVGVVPPTGYQYQPYPRVTLDPARGAPPWRPVRLPGRSGAAWLGAAAGVDRILVEGPVDALRGLRLLHHRDRVDADLAARLRRWSGTADGPPDAVVLVLSRPASAAESEFLTALRSPGGDGFSPVAICALEEGTAATAGSPQRLGSMCDAIVDWRAAPGGGIAVEVALRTWVRARAGVVAARWALRALVACLAAGQLDDRFGRAVEAAVAGAHEVAELDLLQALQGRRIRLPRGHDEALRLLGAYGPDSRSRLGLAGDAGAGQLTQAASRALVFWRNQSMAPDSGPAGRSACALLVRACERLLTDGVE